MKVNSISITTNSYKTNQLHSRNVNRTLHKNKPQTVQTDSNPAFKSGERLYAGMAGGAVVGAAAALAFLTGGAAAPLLVAASGAGAGMEAGAVVGLIAEALKGDKD